MLHFPARPDQGTDTPTTPCAPTKSPRHNEHTHRAERTGRNPSTGEAITTPTAYSVKATAGPKLNKAAKDK
ncbi:HU family DNA-binding protein [Streptomyces sp. NPDC102340]|uniref:HU family DNA-binding protein n=1 Tax=unclassified Streptomyces TaxID=2593676 RepID=UPI0038083EB9